MGNNPFGYAVTNDSRSGVDLRDVYILMYIIDMMNFQGLCTDLYTDYHVTRGGLPDLGCNFRLRKSVKEKDRHISIRHIMYVELNIILYRFRRGILLWVRDRAEYLFWKG